MAFLGDDGEDVELAEFDFGAVHLYAKPYK
jgi:hypothetical protein